MKTFDHMKLNKYFLYLICQPFDEENIIDEEIINEEEHLIIEDATQFSTNADGNAMYIKDESFQAEQMNNSTKKISGTEDSTQYKYVFLDRISNDMLPLESV